jgi:hypothetical protein
MRALYTSRLKNRNRATIAYLIQPMREYPRMAWQTHGYVEAASCRFRNVLSLGYLGLRAPQIAHAISSIRQPARPWDCNAIRGTLLKSQSLTGKFQTGKSPNCLLSRSCCFWPLRHGHIPNAEGVHIQSPGLERDRQIAQLSFVPASVAPGLFGTATFQTLKAFHIQSPGLAAPSGLHGVTFPLTRTLQGFHRYRFARQRKRGPADPPAAFFLTYVSSLLPALDKYVKS